MLFAFIFVLHVQLRIRALVLQVNYGPPVGVAGGCGAQNSKAPKLPEFLSVFVVFGRCPWAPGRCSYSRGPIFESAFLWLCFCRQKPPCKQENREASRSLKQS